MIGNYEDATLALLSDMAEDDTHVLSFDGSSRVVYLINGVVYKVEFKDDINVAEWENVTHHADDLPAGITYPAVSLYRIRPFHIDVLAMEYVEGQVMGLCNCIEDREDHDAMCATESEAALLRSMPKRYDTNGLNFIRTDTGIVCIDAA